MVVPDVHNTLSNVSSMPTVRLTKELWRSVPGFNLPCEDKMVVVHQNLLGGWHERRFQCPILQNCELVFWVIVEISLKI